MPLSRRGEAHGRISVGRGHVLTPAPSWGLWRGMSSTPKKCAPIVDRTPIPTGRWSGRRGSNPRPTAWEAVTLPLSYSRSVYGQKCSSQRELAFCRRSWKFKSIVRCASRDAGESPRRTCVGVCGCAVRTAAGSAGLLAQRGRLLPVCPLVTVCQAGASPPAVRRVRRMPDGRIRVTASREEARSAPDFAAAFSSAPWPVWLSVSGQASSSAQPARPARPGRVGVDPIRTRHPLGLVWPRLEPRPSRPAWTTTQPARPAAARRLSFGSACRTRRPTRDRRPGKSRPRGTP